MVAVVPFSVPVWTNPIVERGYGLDTVVLGLIHTGWLGVPLFLFAVLAHFGRVSYSAYLFSLFTLDFTSRVFPAIKPSGWLSMIAALAMYFVALTAFSTVAFYAVELPFLALRRRYVRAAA